ncbi:MAG: hypothetical protein QOG01_2307, partial [Pseudonocardiales bacterium]|nr:hypothetical protein [Pseudonocardiales bacterium]
MSDIDVGPGRTSAICELVDINGRLTAAVRTGADDEVATLEFLFHRTINLSSGSRKLGHLLRTASLYLPRHFFTADADGAREATRRSRLLPAPARLPLDQQRSRAGTERRWNEPAQQGHQPGEPAQRP